ncbi:MAG: retropepsin-like aspartic protease, partial [Candidatus Cybelea sp.]
IGSGALKIDFEKQTLTLFRSVPPDLAAQGWSPLPVRLDYSVPLVKAAYSNLPGYFVADLGADYSMLYPHYFSRFPNLVPRGAADQDQLETIGGRAFGVKHITMRSLTLGDWVFGGAQVVVPSALYAQDRDYDGLIGRDTLSSFNLIFDYANQRLWFKPIDAGSH